MTNQESAGIADTLRAATRAALVTGLVFGLADGVAAAYLGTADLDLVSLAGCLAGAVFQYCLVALVVLGALGLFFHPLLRRRDRGGRALQLLRIGLALGIFGELYWRTRPYVFYGRSAVAPERLAAALAMLGVAALAGHLLGGVIARLGKSPQRALSAAVLVLLLGGAAYLFTQQSSGDARGTIGARNRDLPNVVLVIVDALRQDVLGCYGNEDVKTPAIDALAARGVVFENAMVQAPFTWTSFGSILTGKYPRRHGLVKMAPGVRMAPNVTLPWHLKSGTKKDGTRLEDGDYVGATFHTGTLSTGSGLLRGFDVYYEGMAGHDLVVLDSAWSVFRSDLLLYIFKNKIGQRFDRSQLATRAAQWIGEHADKRFVTMVHLYATHTPYDPPAEFRKLYVDPGYAGPIKAFYAQYREMIERGEYVPTAADVAQIRALYHGGVSQADHEIGEIVAELERRGILDETLVIVTSDHGESLGEQGLWEHNHMAQTNLRIPLVMSWPNGLVQGKRVPALVDSIDILPTVCDLASLELPHEEPPYGLVDGTSLLPLVRGEVSSVREFSFAENGEYLSVHDLRTKLVVSHALLEAEDPLASWKGALAGELAKPRFYDLVRDPDELENRIDASPAEAERLYAALLAWDAALPVPVSEVVPSDRDIEAALNALGYAGGVGAGREGSQDTDDPAPVAVPANGAQKDP